MVQIRPEPPLRRISTQIGGRGGDDLDVHGPSPHRPEPPHPLLFDGLQEFALEQEGEGLDLVQEQRPPRRRLQQAGLGAFRIGERPGLKAEEFRLQQRLRDGSAVDVDERPLGPRAAVVDDPRHQPFARPGLPLEEHRGRMRTADGVEGGQVADLRAEGTHRQGTAQEAVGRMASWQGAWSSHRKLPACAQIGERRAITDGQNGHSLWLKVAKYG